MLAATLLIKTLDMQILRSEFFEQQGDARQLRTVSITTHRGDIVDRNGEPFAVSAPVNSIWVNPKVAKDHLDEIVDVAKLLSLDAISLKEKIKRNTSREFLYLKRHASPELADEVMALKVPGVALLNEYRRYYPSGEVAAHVIGFSDIDDNGQEGVELAYDDWLKGRSGKKRVIRDRLGRAFDDIERIQSAEPGKSLRLSIDKRLQYLTYRTLKAAVLKHNAVAGSAVVLDVNTGEVLAMVNQPSFNVNDRKQLTPQATRNRAVTDVFEPGSTMKPITIAAALESGRWKPFYKVETAPGYMRVKGNTIRDTKNYGDLDVGGVLEKSSNVGISKIALAIDAEEQWSMYQKMGFGVTTGSGFPGEAGGQLSLDALNNDFVRASMAFGYGVSVTPLQLAHAYSAIAADGVLRPVSFLLDEDANKDGAVAGQRVMSAATARAVRKMMQRVISDKGTGKRASVANYSVAGKTGTVHKFIAGGYAEDRYLSIFSGMVPADKPELVMVVMIDEPRNGEHFGGQVAAPVFSQVMSGAMRLLDIAPDRISNEQLMNADTNTRDSSKEGGEA
ncbi:MAG: penicillin-binding protein 2 [Gammaproteobacteria bacterium]|nr:penicillin-binding protein 2 [Gammaproteobacteria bacterium]MBT8134350.1 penicillin-binding protein 2 [Gammaproteobacteria bacterium]NNJ50640.1 penicillin-binding protein 2 [Gammaproteobacteria bacterium]